MALIVDLKKEEQFIIGDSVIINDTHDRKFTNGGARLHISGGAPMLREKDVMREENANSPAKKVYFSVQSMYLARDPKTLGESYFTFSRQIQDAVPSTASYFMKINEVIQSGSYYKALKETKKLIEYEQRLDNNVTQTNNKIPEQVTD